MTVRMDATVADSLAAMRARMRLGMPIVAIMRITAMTISNSISENPRSFIIGQPIQSCGIAKWFPGKSMHPRGHSVRQSQTVQYMGERRLSAESAGDNGKRPGG